MEQLFERERLDQVVVGTGFQPRDPVGDGGPGGQHQDRHAAALSPKRAADRDAIRAGHHHVEDDGVEGAFFELRQGGDAVLGQLDVEAVDAQSPLSRLANLGVVVDDENAHHSSIAGKSKPSVNF